MSNDPLGRKLVFTAKAVRDAFEETLHEAGASLGIWVVLSALSNEGIVSQTELGGLTHLSGATITHHVDRLEQLGLVRRKPGADDRRVRNLELTREGERLHELLVVAMRGFEQRVFAGVSEKQKTEMRKALERISANLT